MDDKLNQETRKERAEMRVLNIDVPLNSVDGCGCKACHSLRRVEELRNTHLQQGMRCSNCGYGWWSYDPCCSSPKASGKYVEKFWEDQAILHPGGDES